MDSEELEKVRRILTEHVPENCDQEFRQGLRIYARNLDARHSLTSRNPSLRKLALEHLDRPLQRCLRPYLSRTKNKLLEDFQPSVLLWRSPRWQVDPEKATQEPFDSDAITLRATNRRSNAEIEVLDRLELLREWDENLRFANRLAARLFTLTDDPLYAKVSQTLDATRVLISALKLMCPRRVAHPLQDRPLYSRIRPKITIYCDLCWRRVQRSQTAAGHPEVPLSDRFCEYHLPSESPPDYHCYRADVRYRKVFHTELEALHGKRKSDYVLRFLPPAGADTQEIRKAAYDTVHQGLRAVRSKSPDSNNLSENVWKLHLAGVSQADIARMLKTHRQSISRIQRRIDALISTHRREAEIDPVTGESFSLYSPSTQALFTEVQRLRKKGLTTTSIARRAGRFKYTVKAVYRWLDLHRRVQAHVRRGVRLDVISRNLSLSVEVATMLARLKLHRHPPHLVESDNAISPLAYYLRPLSPYLRNDEVTYITINRPGGAFIEQAGLTRYENISRLDLHCIQKLAELVARDTCQALNKQQPLLTAWLSSGERIAIARSPATLQGRIMLSFRKIKTDQLALVDTSKRNADKVQIDNLLAL